MKLQTERETRKKWELKKERDGTNEREREMVRVVVVS